MTSRFVCAGCGAEPDPEALPFRCPRADAGDDVDHVLRRRLDPAPAFPSGPERRPFVRYRSLLHAYHIATDSGMSSTISIAGASQNGPTVTGPPSHSWSPTITSTVERAIQKSSAWVWIARNG